MSDSFSLPLRPLGTKQNKTDTLPIEIAQINAQWGSFRDVSEAGLRDQIAEEKNKDTESNEQEQEEKDTDNDSTADMDTTERLEQLYKRRTEITQFAFQAQMETMFALDLVSLLLSKYAPRQAEMSMSPFLRQVVPLGSLNAEVVNPPAKSEAAELDIKAVSRGWRLQNFNAAADKLLKSATRLEKEVASETKYWGEVLAVKDKGWKVCRLPGERQALAVQYGFIEATPIFRDRGLASLRRADDGSLILDKGLVPSKNRSIRVRVRHNGQITGNSKPPKLMSDADSRSVEGSILQARDNIFEEELFHELVREAKVMANQGVTTRQNLVRFPVSDEQDVLLELVDANDDQDPLGETAAPLGQDNELAEGLAHLIHVLLSYAHRQNLRRRTQIPPPLTRTKRHTGEYQLLRPLMAYLQHESHRRWVQSFLQETCAVVTSSGLNCKHTATPFSSLKAPRNHNHHPPASRVESLIEQLLRPLKSTFTTSLHSPNSSFKVTITTNLSAPPFGTNYDFSVNFPRFSDIQPPPRVALEDDAAAVMTHFFLLDIISTISSYTHAHAHAHAATDNSTTTALPNKNKENDNGNVDNSVKWEATYPHHGELLSFSPSRGINKKMNVSLSNRELSVQTHYVRGSTGIFGQEAESAQSCVWTAGSGGSVPGLMEFVVGALE